MVGCALIHHELTGAPSPVSVLVKGGDTLKVGFEETSKSEYTNVTLFGPADFVFQGTVQL
jgi:diaminopimelate epimerase